MKIPTVHLNGDSYNSLFESHEEAMDTVAVAIHAVGGTAPNGRNFYCQGDDAFAIETATNEHQDRMRRLREVYEELQEITIGILNQKR